MIRIVYTHIGIIIGEKVNAEDGILGLKNPRIMDMKQGENGMLHIDIKPMLGKPKGFEIGNDTMNYDCNDENMLRAYKESVTGVALVQKPPLVDSNGNTLQ